MEHAEIELHIYRQRKRRQALINNIKERIYNMVSWNTGKSEDHQIIIEDSQDNSKNDKSDTESLESDSNEKDAATEETVQHSYVTYLKYALYFIIWVTVFAIAVRLQFGLVYLLFSALLGIYFNTRTGKKSKNEISAYSVFNKNCESIDGTLTAEQFEREIRYGPTSTIKA